MYSSQEMFLSEIGLVLVISVNKKKNSYLGEPQAGLQVDFRVRKI